MKLMCRNRGYYWIFSTIHIQWFNKQRIIPHINMFWLFSLVQKLGCLFTGGWERKESRGLILGLTQNRVNKCDVKTIIHVVRMFHLKDFSTSLIVIRNLSAWQTHCRNNHNILFQRQVSQGFIYSKLSMTQTLVTYNFDNVFVGMTNSSARYRDLSIYAGKDTKICHLMCCSNFQLFEPEMNCLTRTYFKPQ